MMSEDRIWSRHSSDKADISRVLMRVVRRLHRTLPAGLEMRALSLGSGSEPQLQILKAAFGGGLYLLDVDEVPLETVRKDLRNRCIEEGVYTLRGDYCALLASAGSSRGFLRSSLHGERVHLVTMHHSLYYAETSSWKELFRNVLDEILPGHGSVHAVLMSPDCSLEDSTARLYARFAGGFLGARNDQDLAAFSRDIRREPWMRGASVGVETRQVRFSAEDFRQLMSVVWMILLYPSPNRFDQGQMREIAEYVYDVIWSGGRSLVQLQDHLVINR